MFNALRVRQLLAPAQALIALCCLTGLPALAQTPSRDAAAMPVANDPGQAKTPVTPLIYVSVFATYRTLTDEPITPWRDANDLAGRIGGWRAYAREAKP